MLDWWKRRALLSSLAWMSVAACSLAAQATRPMHTVLLVDVSPNGPVRTVREALALVARGGTVLVHSGTYRDSTIVVAMPVRIVADGEAILASRLSRSDGH